MIKKNGSRISLMGIDKRELDIIIKYFQKQGILVKKIIENVPQYNDDHYEDDI